MHPFFEDYLERQSELHTDLEQAIASLSVSALNWSPDPDINSLAVLIVHLTGSERFWIGDVAAQIPSNRNRAAEFEVEGLDGDDLRQRLANNRAFTRQTLESFSLSDLEQKRHTPNNEREVTVGWALLHALEHTALHAGHAQLMRQMWEQQA